MIQASDDGDRLSRDEYRNFFHVLVFAGNETTRTALTHGAMALASHPDQWERIKRDPTLVASAVEEILRWATPVLHMRRTAAASSTLAGTSIAAGDKVVMWYASSNFDEAAFSDPMRFDVAREHQAHQAFGGGGPHFCLGAFLARMEIRVLLEEMVKRDLDLELTAPPVRARSNFVNGVVSVEMAPGQ